MEFRHHTEEFQRKIRTKMGKDYLNGMDTRDIARKYGFSPEATRYILRREGYILYADRKIVTNNPNGRPPLKKQ